MAYGVKKKKKPERKDLTFGMAKNRWFKYMQGRNGYNKAVALIDEIRNDYLLGDEEKWNEWKTTSVIDLDDKLVEFIEWKLSKIDVGKYSLLQLHVYFRGVEMFIDYTNYKLIGTDYWGGSLKKAQRMIMDIVFHSNEEEWEEYDDEEYDDDIEIDENDTKEKYIFLKGGD